MYIRKTRIPSAIIKIPLTVVFIIFGLIIQLFYWPLFLLFIGVALLGLFFHEGILIDFRGQRVKMYSYIVGWKVGKWELLPPAERITIVHLKGPLYAKGPLHTRSSVTDAIYRHPLDFQESWNEVRLYVQGSHDHYVVSTGRLSAVRKDAQLLAKQFKIAYEDFTV